ncbi:MurR/RpiR family transcriptional regulator [Gracilibacillus xinjiangensis]|uniref:MurR/RpiR family transcriptional regulator n=1 Tax=Gracilibacillus xinjiangensis TaxID=1193282 RepID=A0ABV8WSG9_9BACI
MFTHEMIASFNQLETDLYNYISQNTEKAAYMRIRELADETHVSTATILRFCRKVGCAGFTEFKIMLKMGLEDKKKTVIKSPQHSITEFFERTLNNRELEGNLEEAASAISEAENVVFIGMGSSGILAEYGARYFSASGKFSLYIKDPHFPIHKKFQDSSITVVLSVSGDNPFTITQINQLKQEGSKVISITNNRLSTIAKISDINIAYYVTEERYQSANITTQVPVIYILEAIARKISIVN